MVEAEMYDTNNKRSLDLSEFKKERCLNFWKVAYSVSQFISNEPNIWLNPQVLVQNFKLLMRWNKTLTQYFPAVKNNQCPDSGFL